MRLLSVGNHPESSSLPLHCSTKTLVFTLMPEALLLLREYCPILLSCPHMEHCSGLTLSRDFRLVEFTDSVVMFQEPSQWPSPMATSLSEGAPLELRCNYSISLQPNLCWYVQYPNQGLQLLKYMSGNNLVSAIKAFASEFRKSETSFHLRKKPTEVMWPSTSMLWVTWWLGL